MTKCGMEIYRLAGIEARMKYARLPWWERLLTCPPPGWQGAWVARVLSRVTGLSVETSRVDPK